MRVRYRGDTGGVLRGGAGKGMLKGVVRGRYARGKGVVKGVVREW